MIKNLKVGDIVTFNDGSWAVEVVSEGGRVKLRGNCCPANSYSGRRNQRWRILATNLNLPVDENGLKNEIRITWGNGKFINDTLLEGIDTNTLIFTNLSSLILSKTYEDNPATLKCPNGKEITLSAETWENLKNNI